MNTLSQIASPLKYISRSVAVLVTALILAAPAFAQTGSPWENATPESPRPHIEGVRPDRETRILCRR